MPVGPRASTHPRPSVCEASESPSAPARRAGPRESTRFSGWRSSSSCGMPASSENKNRRVETADAVLRALSRRGREAKASPLVSFLFLRRRKTPRPGFLRVSRRVRSRPPELHAFNQWGSSPAPSFACFFHLGSVRQFQRNTSGSGPPHPKGLASLILSNCVRVTSAQGSPELSAIELELQNTPQPRTWKIMNARVS